MPDLTPMPPLGGPEPRRARHGAMSLTEEVAFSLASVALRERQQEPGRAALDGLLGGPAPGVSGARSGIGAGMGMEAFWIGPDQWMLSAPIETHPDLAAFVRDRLGPTASVTEQTDGWARFDLEGPGLASVMELLCPVDEAWLQPGTATRTQIEHLGCFLLRTRSTTCRVYGPRSAAASLWHRLDTAIRTAISLRSAGSAGLPPAD